MICVRFAVHTQTKQASYSGRKYLVVRQRTMPITATDPKSLCLGVTARFLMAHATMAIVFVFVIGSGELARVFVVGRILACAFFSTCLTPRICSPRLAETSFSL
jgi:hypothetical protein